MVALGVAAAGMVGVVAAQTTPALADPASTPTTYVAVGSDTTQDVMNAIAANIGGNAIGSWNAVNPAGGPPHDIIAPKAGCSFARPNGSGEGVAALRYSVNPNSGATPPSPPPQPGCVDIARSSSGPGGNANTGGQFIYVPYALDAVAGSVGPATGGVVGGVTTVPTNITQANQFTVNDLKALYDNGTPVTEGGVTYWPLGSTTPQPPGSTVIDLYIPQSGSGTRNFWATTLGFPAATPPAWVYDTIQAGADKGLSVEEHDGTAVATDPNGFGPFSIAQWIGQRNGHNDRRHGAVVTNLTPCSNSTTCTPPPVSPFDNGNPTTGKLNTAFPITREVYNVLQYDRVFNTGDGKFDATLAGYFVGTGSSVCSASLTIQNYGFATLHTSTPNPTPHNCGDLDQNLRAFLNG
jgi:phosphate transport system substrate-binding protein